MSIKPSLSSAATELQRLVVAAAELATTSKKKPHIIEAYSLAFDQVDAVASSIPPKVPSFANTKRALRVVSNLIGGTLDGLHSNDLSVKELRSISKDLLAERIPAFIATASEEIQKHNLRYGTSSQPEIGSEQFAGDDEVLASLEEAASKPKRISRASLSASKSFQEALQDAVKDLKGNPASKEKIDEDEEEESEEEQPTPSKDMSKDATYAYLKNLVSFRKRLPTSMGKKPFTLLRMPVVPIFHAVDRSGGTRVQGLGMNVMAQPNPTHILSYVGIRSVAVEEYVVIDNQIMLVVNLDALPKKTIIKRRKEEEVPVDADEYVKYVLDTLAESSSTTYALVDDKPIKNPRTPRILLYWIMPSKTLSVLSRKGFPKIRQWGLPFSS